MTETNSPKGIADMAATDRHLPASADLNKTAKFRFYTANGWLTRYALACGYVEIRGDDESGVRLEQISSNGALRVIGTGRWIRSENMWLGRDLKAARKAFRKFNHLTLTKTIADAHLAAVAA